MKHDTFGFECRQSELEGGPAAPRCVALARSLACVCACWRATFFNVDSQRNEVVLTSEASVVGAEVDSRLVSASRAFSALTCVFQDNDISIHPKLPGPILPVVR